MNDEQMRQMAREAYGLYWDTAPLWLKACVVLTVLALISCVVWLPAIYFELKSQGKKPQKKNEYTPDPRHIPRQAGQNLSTASHVSDSLQASAEHESGGLTDPYAKPTTYPAPVDADAKYQPKS